MKTNFPVFRAFHNEMKKYFRSAPTNGIYSFVKCFSIALIAVTIMSCAGTGPKKNSSPLQFAVVGNTCSESPFRQTHSDMPRLISALNRSNPAIVIHTGNIVFAGFTSGIREEDVTRQFKTAEQVFEQLDRARHFVPGELDTFNGSTTAFSSFTGRDPYNTFIYGSVLFIVLNTTDPEPGKISDEQFSWLCDTLEDSRNESIIVVTHHPLLRLRGYDGTVVENADRVTMLFQHYPVRAAISGAGESFSMIERDSTSYYNLGCVPLYKPCGKDQNRYYLATFSDERLIVEGMKL